MLISLVFEDTKIEQDIYQAINSSFPRRIKFRPSKYLSQLNCKISQDSYSQKNFFIKTCQDLKEVMSFSLIIRLLDR